MFADDGVVVGFAECDAPEADEADAGFGSCAAEGVGVDFDLGCGGGAGEWVCGAGVPGFGGELGAEVVEEVGVGLWWGEPGFECGADASFEVGEWVAFAVVGEFEFFGVCEGDGLGGAFDGAADGGGEGLPEVWGWGGRGVFGDLECGGGDAEGAQERAVAGFVDSAVEEGHGFEGNRGRTLADDAPVSAEVARWGREVAQSSGNPWSF